MSGAASASSSATWGKASRSCSTTRSSWPRTSAETVAGRWCAPCEKVLGSHARLGTLGHSGEQVGHEVGAAALPTGSSEHRGDGVLQPPCFRRGSPWWASEVTSSTPLSPRAVNDLRKAIQRSWPRNSPPLLPNESAEPGEPPSPGLEFTLADLRAGPESGSAWPGGLRFGGADTLNIEFSLWRDCSCIVPPLVSSAYFRCCTRGIASQYAFRTTGFQPSPPLTAVPCCRIQWCRGVCPIWVPERGSSSPIAFATWGRKIRPQ